MSAARSQAAAAVRERPILFSGPMVRALIAGTKTQTRRVVRLPPASSWMLGSLDRGTAVFVQAGNPAIGDALRCPYGAPGDRLWVRETRAIPEGSDAPLDVAYRADIPPDAESDERWAKRNMIGAAKWRPSIHMIRAFSRITLEITGSRVERLQAITEEDARAEGVAEHWSQEKWTAFDTRTQAYPTYYGDPTGMPGVESVRRHPPERLLTARAAFAQLWGAINAKRAPWSANPWVWALSFRVVDGGRQ